MLFKFVKRIIDLSISIVLIVLTLPIQLLISIAILVLLRENPFFTQKRGITLSNQCFNILKFRTIKSTEAIKIEHSHWKEIFLIQKATVNIGRFSRFLRLTGLDELPQIFNVLIGNMSFVGPRPLMIRDLQIMKNQFPKQYEIRDELKSKPGITGAWQLIGDRNQGVENLIAHDLFYEQNCSILLDSKIFLMTIPLVLFAKNSDAIVPKIEFVSKFFSYSLKEFHISKKTKSSKNHYENYFVKLPSFWWYTSNSYNVEKKPSAKIILLDSNKSKKSASN